MAKAAKLSSHEHGLGVDKVDVRVVSLFGILPINEVSGFFDKEHVNTWVSENSPPDLGGWVMTHISLYRWWVCHSGLCELSNEMEWCYLLYRRPTEAIPVA